MVDQEIRVLGDENIIANPKNSQKQYPLTFKAVPNVIVYGRKKDNLNFTVPIPEGVNFNFNLDRTSIIFADNFNLEEYSYIMVKNPFEEIQDFFYVSSLEELDPTGKEFNEFNDEVVKWLRRLVNIISNRCMIFETTLFKDLNNFPNIKTGQTFIRTEDGWTGITIRDINSELDLIFNKYVEEVNKKIKEHETKMNEHLEQWKEDIKKYAENVKQYEIVRVVTQTGHGFLFDPVMYSISQRKFVKAVFPHGADGIAVRVDDNNFRLVWAGRVEIPAAAKDTQQRDFVLGEYYFLGEGSNGGIQREKPDTYYQHLFQVMYSDELQQNIADVLLSVPINQKGKRWDVGEAKTTVNDIEELKMSDFPVGKVVEVLGYYKAGDGADHKRIIKAEDDGSGVQLRSGKWANIAHSGEVKVCCAGISKSKSATENSVIFNKLIGVNSIKTLVLTEDIKVNNIKITREDILIKGYERVNVARGRLVTIDCEREDLFNCDDVSSISLKDISIIYYKNAITSSNANNFRLSINNISMNTGEVGINFSTADNNDYKSFGFSTYINGLYITGAKIGINIDFKSKKSTNWINSFSIKESLIVDNEVGIKINGLGRAECFELINVDLSQNNCKQKDNFINLKNKLSSGEYGGLILKNSEGCNISLKNVYMEYCGSMVLLNDNAIKNEIKNENNLIFTKTYEKDGVYTNGDGENIVFTDSHFPINMINCSSCGFEINNSFIMIGCGIIKSIGGVNNRFITVGYNDIGTSLEYFNKKYEILNNTVQDFNYIKISNATTPSKKIDDNFIYKLKNEFIDYLKNRGTEHNESIYDILDLSNLSSMGDFCSALSYMKKAIDLKGTFNGTLKYRYKAIMTSLNMVFLDGIFNIKQIDNDVVFLSLQSSGNVSFYRTTFNITSDKDFIFFTSIGAGNLIFNRCTFNFNNYTAKNFNINCYGKVDFIGCNFVGTKPTINVNGIPLQ